MRLKEGGAHDFRPGVAADASSMGGEGGGRAAARPAPHSERVRPHTDRLPSGSAWAQRGARSRVAARQAGTKKKRRQAVAAREGKGGGGGRAPCGMGWCPPLSQRSRRLKPPPRPQRGRRGRRWRAEAQGRDDAAPNGGEGDRAPLCPPSLCVPLSHTPLSVFLTSGLTHLKELSLGATWRAAMVGVGGLKRWGGCGRRRNERVKKKKKLRERVGGRADERASASSPPTRTSTPSPSLRPPTLRQHSGGARTPPFSATPFMPPLAAPTAPPPASSALRASALLPTVARPPMHVARARAAALLRRALPSGQAGGWGPGGPAAGTPPPVDNQVRGAEERAGGGQSRRVPLLVGES